MLPVSAEEISPHDITHSCTAHLCSLFIEFHGVTLNLEVRFGVRFGLGLGIRFGIILAGSLIISLGRSLLGVSLGL